MWSCDSSWSWQVQQGRIPGGSRAGAEQAPALEDPWDRRHASPVGPFLCPLPVMSRPCTFSWRLYSPCPTWEMQEEPEEGSLLLMVTPACGFRASSSLQTGLGW